MINQVCGCFYHTTSIAGWAKTAKFAGKGYQVFESATVAFHTKKTMFQQSASKVFAEFIVNKSR
jgi:hypothetical protein